MQHGGITILLLIFFLCSYAQGNYVFSGAEAVNFGTISLAAPGGQTWSTARTATPGYFSAVNGASFTDASDAAHVNGYVKKYGNEAFTFPIGTGTDLRALSISAPTSATDAYAAAWILGNPATTTDPTDGGVHSTTSLAPDISAVADAGYWDWQAISGSGAGLTISVSMPDLNYFDEGLNLRLVGWNGIRWVNLSGVTGPFSNDENTIITGTMIAGITALAIGSSNFILPVTLTSFTGAIVNCNTAKLSWSITDAIGFERFELQRSTNGLAFSTIETIAYLAGASTYDATDSSLSGNMSYQYRLKLADKNGQYKYSKVIALKSNCSGSLAISLYPNPAGNVVTVAGLNGHETILLYDLQGKLQQSIRPSGKSNQMLPLDRVAAGIYTVVVIMEGRVVKTLKLVRQ
ncbi:MAG: T9SS type A sorting domain-containing protein [Chitinophagaceae bacterium]|nr:T9SS type A sorting domain-containing protein [Chitinophagaceae bacterium]